ncbi:MAG: histidinol-phosphatase [Ignavibacteria bacterium GWA2_55_11]|nr:MAG: histidinol-phosphatase [Ignavibacteria bacterium GWA2_55_11]
MDKKQVAAILDEIGTLLELQGANPFKSRAFHNGARTIEALTDDLATLVESEKLTDVKGIGEGLAKVVLDLVKKGKSKDYDDLKRKIPDGVLAMTRLQGLGPKRVKILFEELKIDSLEKLEKACQKHTIAALEGFGTKTEENILRSIEAAKKTSDKHLFPEARAAADDLLKSLKDLQGVALCEVAGSLRRRKEIIGDIDLLVAASGKSKNFVFDAFTKHSSVERIVAKGDTKSSVVLHGGIACDLRVVEKKEFPFALNYFTGSKEHNVEMRSIARKKGLSLNEYGFTKIENAPSGTRVPSCSTEEEIYKALGLAYVPPELRENGGECAAAKTGKMPTLIDVEDLRGTFHCHTTYSDGHNTLQQMAEAAKARGWSYWGVADHSRVAAYAGGLTPERVRKQHAEVDALNEAMKGFRIFKGTECDILADGSLDFPDKVLATFDYVVVSIHSKFNMTAVEATKRVIKALQNKYATFLGHPTGRLLLSRDGYPVDVKAVIDVAADFGKSIEINAHPVRLDLDWRWVRYARDKGVPIAINPDAHNVDGLDDVRYGVGIARKGWLEKKHVVNAWSVEEVERFFASVRTSKKG